jgi:small subunit ribosomal protein S10
MKIYIILKSFQKELINHTLLNMIEQLKNYNCKIFGVVFLPLKIKKFCVLRSPQIDEDSREHLEIRTYKCFISTDLTTIEQIDQLLNLNIPEGIYCTFKMI